MTRPLTFKTPRGATVQIDAFGAATVNGQPHTATGAAFVRSGAEGPHFALARGVKAQVQTSDVERVLAWLAEVEQAAAERAAQYRTSGEARSDQLAARMYRRNSDL